jgi:CHAT domain-containing protein/tetratricopeptide (TPR) repeat protein
VTHALEDHIPQLGDGDNLAKAIAAAEESLARCEAALGPEHSEVSTLLEKLVGLHKAQGALSTVEALYKRLLQIREKTLGKDHLDVATTVSDMAMLYRDTGAYELAEQFYLRALDIRERARGLDHPDVASSLHGLAVLYLKVGDTTTAEPLCERARGIRERAFGPDHAEVASSLGILAALHFTRGAYAQAESLFERALSIRERAPERDSVEIANLLLNFAAVPNARGAYAKATELLTRATDILEATLGPEHPKLAPALYNHAVIRAEQGEYAKAEPLYERALHILEVKSGRDHPDVIRPLNSLAMLYRAQGAYDKAKSLHLRALHICEAALGPERVQTAECLSSLAMVYLAQHEYAEADSLFKRALGIREQTLPPGHPDIAATLSNLGVVCILKGAYVEAEPLCERAARELESTYGPDNPDVADALENLAGVYQAQRVYGEAKALYERVLTTREQVLGPTHPDVADALENLGALSWVTNELSSAIEYYKRGSTVREHYLGATLATLPESRMRMLLNIGRAQTETLVSFHAHATFEHADALELALTAVLRRKGRVLEEAASARAALQRHLSPDLQRDLQRVAGISTELATRRLAGDQHAEELQELELEVNRIESRLSRQSAELRAYVQPLTLHGIQTHVPENAALIEFVRYRRAEPHNADQPWQEHHYLAYIIQPEAPPRCIPLGEAALIETAIMSALEVLTHPDVNPRQQLRLLDELIFEPIRKAAAKTQFLISPDGHLHLVPFAALIDRDGRYLIEYTSITYLASGRDLVPAQRDHPRSKPLVVAAPDYQGRYKPLRGAEEEGRTLKKLFVNIDLAVGPAATKDVLSRARAPVFVHVATHGYFRASATTGRGQARGLERDLGGGLPRSRALPLPDIDADVDSALDMAGLILAGATEAEATLTAREVAQIDLRGTRLVVLSACDTGVGQIGSSEGVYGLRRALAIAGAETQLVSLWKVDDDATSGLIAHYYDALRKERRAEALQLAQQALLRSQQYAHPSYWAAFVPVGDAPPLELSLPQSQSAATPES